jgi:hypothetical protein
VESFSRQRGYYVDGQLDGSISASAADSGDGGSKTRRVKADITARNLTIAERLDGQTFQWPARRTELRKTAGGEMATVQERAEDLPLTEGAYIKGQTGDSWAKAKVVPHVTSGSAGGFSDNAGYSR